MFSAPSLVTGINIGGFDADAWISPDLLEVYFTSNRTGGVGGKDIWTSRRASASDAWPAATVAPVINSASDDISPHGSADGLTIWFSSTRAGGQGGIDMWLSTRPSVGASWTAPVPLTELNTAQYDGAFATTASGLVGYFQSLRGGNLDMYRTERATTSDPWSPPVPVSELNTTGQDQNPFPSSDDRVLFFSSGDTSVERLYMATRPAPQAPFDPPIELTTLNAGVYDSDPTLGDGLHYIMFSSNRTGVFQLYEATR
jgi:hypothetical protein